MVLEHLAVHGIPIDQVDDTIEGVVTKRRTPGLAERGRPRTTRDEPLVAKIADDTVVAFNQTPRSLSRFRVRSRSLPNTLRRLGSEAMTLVDTRSLRSKIIWTAKKYSDVQVTDETLNNG